MRFDMKFFMIYFRAQDTQKVSFFFGATERPPTIGLQLVLLISSAIKTLHTYSILHFTVFLVEEEEEDLALISQPRVETQCPHNLHRY